MIEPEKFRRQRRSISPRIAGVIARRRAGEQRQVAVGIAPILVKMEMDDRDLRRELVHEVQIAVLRRGAEIGVTQIQAHPHVRRGDIIQPAQALEQFIEHLRRVKRRVFDGQAQPGFPVTAGPGAG